MEIKIKETPSFQPFDFVIQVKSTVDAAGLLALFAASNSSLQTSCPDIDIDKNYSTKDLLAAFLKAEYTNKLYRTLLNHLFPNS